MNMARVRIRRFVRWSETVLLVLSWITESSFAFSLLSRRSPPSQVRDRVLQSVSSDRSRLEWNYARRGQSLLDKTKSDDENDVPAIRKPADSVNGSSDYFFKSVTATPSFPLAAAKRRKMELMWCGEDFCKDAIRERVVGDNNQVMLNGPATGQVAYAWWNDNDGDDEIEETLLQAVASILFLVRPGDDDLMRIAADTVRELEDDPLHILLDPSTAARLKHYHGVDQDNICLFEPQPTPGFGSNLRPSEVSSSIPYPWKTNPSVANPPHGEHEAFPDLICTIGGDGLLMHAAMLFQGPIPPILAVAGGSLGFLTPFSKEEMVDAIRVSLGMLQLDGATATKNSALVQAGDTKVFPPNMPSYPYEPLLRHPQLRCFGYDSRICLSIRMRLECRILNGQGAVRARYNVLNEVVIDRGSSPYLAALECFCDDVHLTTVQADGIIFATPTGSTAYSMAAGGSVVHPAVPAILVTPICPHVLSFRSMVFPDHVVLRCYVPDDARAEASVAFDGKHRQELHRGDSVQIQMSAYPVPTINRMDHSSDWLGSLKQNFNFNTRPRQRPL